MTDEAAKTGALAEWNRLLADARTTLTETAAATAGRDPAGLLTLAGWIATGAEEMSDCAAIAIARAYGTEVAEIGAADLRIALEELLYDELWEMLRSGGWLEEPDWKFPR
jgi:hypothetical protein